MSETINHTESSTPSPAFSPDDEIGIDALKERFNAPHLRTDRKPVTARPAPEGEGRLVWPPKQRSSRTEHVSFPIQTREDISAAGAVDAAEAIDRSATEHESEEAEIKALGDMFENEAARNRSINVNGGPFVEDSPVESFPAQPEIETTEPATQSKSRVAQILRSIERAAGNKAEKKEKKAVLRQTGRSAAHEARLLELGINNNAVSRFIDKIGINSEEARAKDGQLAKRLSKEGRQAAAARREERRVANLEKNFVTDIDEAHDMANEIDDEREDRILAAKLDAEAYANQAQADADAKATAIYHELKADADADAAAMKETIMSRAGGYVGNEEPVKTKKTLKIKLPKITKKTKSSNMASAGAGAGMGTGTPTGESKKSSLFDKMLSNISKYSR
jgi:hypothetical protein